MSFYRPLLQCKLIFIKLYSVHREIPKWLSSGHWSSISLCRHEASTVRADVSIYLSSFGTKSPRVTFGVLAFVQTPWACDRHHAIVTVETKPDCRPRRRSQNSWLQQAGQSCSVTEVGIVLGWRRAQVCNQNVVAATRYLSKCCRKWLN